MRIFYSAIFIFLFSSTHALPLPPHAKQKGNPTKVNTDTSIHWMTMEQALAAQKKTPKKIFIDFYTSWCYWCKVADTAVFKNPVIANYINQHFYAVRFDAESQLPVSYLGEMYKQNSDLSYKTHPFAQMMLRGRISYPASSFLDETGKLIDTKYGYMDAYYFEAVLNYYGTGAYKKMKYFDFEFDFEGQIP